MSLSHKEDVITLKFAALDFADPRANRYEYKLDGFDNAWVRADERRAATYTNLPGGQYVFRVRASNSDGVWSTKNLALPIDVAPSPWLSPMGVFRVLRAVPVHAAGRLVRAAATYRPRGDPSARAGTAGQRSNLRTGAAQPRTRRTRTVAWRWPASPIRSPASPTAAT